MSDAFRQLEDQQKRHYVKFMAYCLALEQGVAELEAHIRATEEIAHGEAAPENYEALREEYKGEAKAGIRDLCKHYHQQVLEVFERNSPGMTARIDDRPLDSL